VYLRVKKKMSTRVIKVYRADPTKTDHEKLRRVTNRLRNDVAQARAERKSRSFPINLMGIMTTANGTRIVYSR
jgi:hypothetical protein